MPQGHGFTESTKISTMFPVIRLHGARGVEDSGWNKLWLYNHIPGLPPRVLLAWLSCSENTAFKRSGRLFCWKTILATLSLQVTWKRERHCMKGRWVIHTGMAFFWDVCQHSSMATGHCLMTISHEDCWLPSHRPSDPAFVCIQIELF